MATVQLSNTFETGLTSGTTVTTGNSGGTAGHAFAQVTIGTGAALTYDGASPLSGLLSLRASTGTTSATAVGTWASGLAGIGSHTWTRAVIQWATAQTAGTATFLHTSTNSGQVWRLDVTTAGKLELRNSTDTVIATSSATMTAGTTVWRVVVEANTVTNPSGNLYIWYTATSTGTPDETIPFSQTGTQLGTSDIAFLDAGLQTAVASAAVRIDDVLITNLGLPGPQYVTGSAAGAFGGLSAAASGVADMSGSGSAALGGLSASATGVPAVTGSGSAALGGLSAAASGVLATTGTATAAFGTLSASAAGVAVMPPEVNPYWPKTSFQVAFNADPNDPDTEPEWSDLTRKLLYWNSSFGRQYETDTNQSGEADATLDDRDEVLNPANDDSPFLDGLYPMRQYLHQAMWPPQPVGAATNMLNHWSGFDPTIESYPTGTETVPWISDTIGSGVIPAVTDTMAWQGTQSLTWTVAGTGDTSGIGWLVYTIPGDTYTASVYFRQTAANATHLYVNGGDIGGETTDTGTWVRLTQTFTAWEWVHLIWVRSNPTGHAGTCYLDGFQVEPGDTATTFDDSGDGPVVYGISKGFVEHWPSTWTFNGHRGQCQIECVDAMAAMSRIGMTAEYPAALTAAEPTWWWRINDQAGATRYADQAGIVPAFLQPQNSASGPGQINAGTDLTYPGNPSGTGAGISGTSISGSHTKGSGLTAGLTGPALGLGGPTGSGNTWGATLALVVSGVAPADLTNVWNLATLTSGGGYLDPNGGSFLTVSIGPISGGGYGFHFTAGRWTGTTPGWSGTVTLSNADTDSGAYFDGTAKLLIASLTWDGTELTISGQFGDGSGYDGNSSHTVSSATIGGLPIYLDAIQVGGIFDASTTGVDQSDLAGYDSTYAEIALWNIDIGVATTTALTLFDAFSGYTGEFPGERISRWLRTYFHEYATYTAIDNGTSPMGPGNVSDQAKLLDAIQYVTTSENGDFWIDQWGVIQFTARTDRWRKTSAVWILGEDLAGGEYPYEDSIEFDYDDTLVYNLIQITQTGGLVYITQDEASKKRYFQSELDIEIGLQNAEDVVATGDWQRATHKDAQQRVAGLQVKPSANPALWRFVLGARKGDRVKVMRRTKPGVIVNLDFFIERIEHEHSAGSWVSSYEASPVAGQMAWILGDPVLGKLGFTTRLGY